MNQKKTLPASRQSVPFVLCSVGCMVLLSACPGSDSLSSGSKPQQAVVTTPVLPSQRHVGPCPVLLEVLGDNTTSTRYSAVWTLPDVRAAYMELSLVPGSRIICLSVLARSSNQSVHPVVVRSPDTAASRSANFFRRSRQAQDNRLRCNSMIPAMDSDVTMLAATLCAPKNEQASDVNGALALLCMTASEDVYSGFDKVVLISSDLEPWPRQPLRPVMFPAGTRILVVRPGNLNIDDLKRIFPNNSASVSVYSNVADALSAISSFINNKNQ